MMNIYDKRILYYSPICNVLVVVRDLKNGRYLLEDQHVVVTYNIDPRKLGYVKVGEL